jgi:D-alanyl-D-alanine carboxypeptidase/D-alanyl-D-alanine-endopeptidase (penicillin-binding protein 4)
MFPVDHNGFTPLFSYASPPLRELLPHFLKPSQNQMGEILLKTIGLVRTGSGTADSGAAVASRRLRAWGADSTGFIMRDGSGLSRHNYLSPRTLVRVLDVMRRDSLFMVFHDAMPIAGIDGTLERRMVRTPAQGNVRAKTGSMDRVRSLAGYVTTADGRQLLFALFANPYAVPGTEVDAAMDTIVARLADLRASRRDQR